MAVRRELSAAGLRRPDFRLHLPFGLLAREYLPLDQSGLPHVVVRTLLSVRYLLQLHLVLGRHRRPPTAHIPPADRLVLPRSLLEPPAALLPEHPQLRLGGLEAERRKRRRLGRRRRKWRRGKPERRRAQLQHRGHVSSAFQRMEP